MRLSKYYIVAKERGEDTYLYSALGKEERGDKRDVDGYMVTDGWKVVPDYYVDEMAEALHSLRGISFNNKEDAMKQLSMLIERQCMPSIIKEIDMMSVQNKELSVIEYMQVISQLPD